ncbi:MAG: NfeD family protein [Lentimicrobiaceae bacterium]|jgi:membrane-bound serine protease (ClpP class)|nr:NfeD family protein [Lentimicrobiaceae bacterium]MDD4599176.1 NfeD family protein [Lentimicrobiaceae bacterium]MDY0026260.1 NfeD family protein [Lentimicrobium sp.]
MKSLCLMLLTCLGIGCIQPATAQQDTTDKKSGIIYQFEIREEIAPPVWHRTKKALKEAKAMNASIILIHMNTYGGMVETADSIRTAILKSSIPVWVYIDNNAASAGALISIACDSIYMREGANIGAATVVNQTGEAMPDKYQSYMRSTMRSTAEATGRDPDIAQGMVDPRVYIPGITDSNQVITFTASEAIKYNYCNAQVNSVADILKITGRQNYTIVKQKLTATDHIIGFLTKPLISGLLIMLIIGGIYFELQTPGIGFPLGAAVFGALLYFAPLYVEGLAANWEILIFIVGLVLLAIEIFAIPGFGVAGISGIILMVTGLTLSMIDNIGFDFTGVQLNGLAEAFFIVIIASFLSIIGSFYLTRKLFGTSTIFGNLALMTTQPQSEGYVSSDSQYTEMLGQTGETYTILRPAGKVMINGKMFDAVAQTGYIDKGEAVRIVKYENAQLIVRKV